MSEANHARELEIRTRKQNRAEENDKAVMYVWLATDE